MFVGFAYVDWGAFDALNAFIDVYFIVGTSFHSLQSRSGRGCRT